MSIEETNRFGFNIIVPSEGNQEMLVNENTALLDALLQSRVISKSLAVPPAEPSKSDAYIVAEDGEDAWEGKDVQLAIWINSAWAFFPLQEGWRFWVEDEDQLQVYDGSEFVGVDGAPSAKLIQLRRTSDQSLTNGVWTNFLWQASLIHDSADYGWSSSADPERITVLASGVYEIVSEITISSTQQGMRLMRVRVNDADIVNGFAANGPGSSGGSTTSVSTLLTLDADDFISVQVQSSHGLGSGSARADGCRIFVRKVRS